MKKAVRDFVIVAAGCVVLAVMLSAPGAGAQPPTSSEDAADQGAVVFYFHGNVRCATCKKIEAYADEAVHSGFAEALEVGDLEWRVVNIDEKENRHFVQDFQLVTRSVVLVEYRDGKVARWENLEKVWQLVRDKERFVGYVQAETRDFLGTGE